MTEATRPGPEAPSGTQPMQHGHRPASSSQVEATLVPEQGWHFLHLFYRIDREILGRLAHDQRRNGAEELRQALERAAGPRPVQMQSFLMVGHKADFGILLADPDPMTLHAVQQDIQASSLGPALVPTYSFYSITEISEYVPDTDQYAELLRREGMDPESASFKTRVTQYGNRLGPMNKQRLTPEFPDWPAVCFYPMSKMRTEGQNWYLLPFEERSQMMAEHGKSGMKFAGKVTQVITASTGLDDWEWGVTLWARNPQYLKDIVYTMRFDRSSAQYALFGPFYPGFILPPADLVGRLRL